MTEEYSKDGLTKVLNKTRMFRLHLYMKILLIKPSFEKALDTILSVCALKLKDE